MAMLNYTGDLYAKLWKRKYIKLEMTAADVDKLQKENEELKAINAHTISQLNLQNGELIIENQKLKNKLQNKKKKPTS